MTALGRILIIAIVAYTLAAVLVVLFAAGVL